MRWQSTWPQKDIFHEFALDFAKKVNEMTGGDLKIDVLPAGELTLCYRKARSFLDSSGSNEDILPFLSFKVEKVLLEKLEVKGGRDALMATFAAFVTDIKPLVPAA